MNKINRQILCILLDYIYIVFEYNLRNFVFRKVIRPGISIFKSLTVLEVKVPQVSQTVRNLGSQNGYVGHLNLLTYATVVRCIYRSF